ncbi:hypothetical protein ACFLV7_02615 [Chloroflexota bacterium]
MKNILLSFLFVLVVGVVLSACTSAVQENFDTNEDELAIFQSTEHTCIFTDAELKNTEYQSEWIDSGIVKLTNGEYREQAALGSASEIVIMLTDHAACGKLEGQDAIAVILVSSGGGSGSFYDLAVLVKTEGRSENVAIQSLGDRVMVNSLVIENDEIVLDMLTHGPDDPMCCPTQPVVKIYKLQDNEILEKNEL